jgi:hypothetical protein
MANQIKYRHHGRINTGDGLWLQKRQGIITNQISFSMDKLLIRRYCILGVLIQI